MIDYESLVVSFESQLRISTLWKAGEDYRFAASDTVDASDLQVMAQYPQITNVYSLQVSDNLKNAKISFGVGSNYYVYRASDLAYLGTNANGVAVADKYYLAASKLNQASTPKYSIRYHADGADGGVVPVDPKTYYPGQIVNILFTCDDFIYNDNAVFRGWQRIISENERYVYQEDPIFPYMNQTLMDTCNIDLYPVWRYIDHVVDKPLKIAGYNSTESLTLDPGAVLYIPIKNAFVWYGTPSKVNLDTLRDSSINTLIGKLGSVLSKRIEVVPFEDFFAYKLQFASPQYDTLFEGVLSIYGRNSSSKTAISGVLKGTGIAPSTGVDSSSSENMGSNSNVNLGGGSSSFTVNSFIGNTPSISAEEVAKLTKGALATAKTSSKQKAVIQFRNLQSLSLAAMHTAAEQANGFPVAMVADTMRPDGSGVDVRIILDPAKANKDLLLSASTTSEQAQKTLQHFAKYYTNKLSIVSFSQQGGFGMPVEIAVKLDPSFDHSNLVFYTYDKQTNAIQKIEHPSYWIDANGYLHFTTEFAGDIIISNGLLKNK